MNVTSTVEAYLRLVDVPAGDARLEAWVSQYEAAHADVFEAYYRSWGRRERRASAAAEVDQLAALVAQREARALELLAATNADFKAAGYLPASDDLDVVLLVGGHTSNGWVTDLNGRQKLFLALEFIGDEPFDDLLVVHESLHLAHHLRCGDRQPETVADRLFDEGLAVAISRLLRPGHPDSAYLWFDDTHQGWIDDCAARAEEIRDQITADLDNADEKTVGAYFSMSSAVGLPPRCGYWLGDALVTTLLARHNDASEIIAWSNSDIREWLSGALG